MDETMNDMDDLLIHPRLAESLDVSEHSVVESFPWQRVVLPHSAIAASMQRPLLSGLLPTDIGSFTHASQHFCLRESGSEQAIFAYCVAGRGWFDLGQKRKPVRAGELLVLRPGTPHAYAADPQDPWTIHWFHVTGRHVSDFLQELDVETASVIYLGPDSALVALFQEALSVIEQGYSSTQLLRASHTLGHLLSLFVAKRREFWRHEPDAVQAVAATIEFMNNHLHQSLNVRTLAAQANLSASHYSALFKRQTGYAPIDYFTRLRMHRVCQLLEGSQHSIKTIAAMFGYEDPMYFSRVFKQVNGVSPSEYRRAKRLRM
jgi:AraC-like DNA-binding protein